MKRMPLAVACLLAAGLVPAAGQPAPTQEMVLLPRSLVDEALRWIADPNAGNAVHLFASLDACLSDNPNNGRLARIGPDRCAVVTEALAAQAKALTDAATAAKTDAVKPPGSMPEHR
jgi:hypothetical protein